MLSDGGGTHILSCAVDMDTGARSVALSFPSPHLWFVMGSRQAQPTISLLMMDVSTFVLSAKLAL